MVLINPGSRIGGAPHGWTNTPETARAEAEKWLAGMREDGLVDVELLDEVVENEGRWRFGFRHTVTGTVVFLETHGIDDLDAYQRQHLFPPRVYWRGSSTAEPKLDDFAADGFEPVKTFRAKDARR